MAMSKSCSILDSLFLSRLLFVGTDPDLVGTDPDLVGTYPDLVGTDPGIKHDLVGIGPDIESELFISGLLFAEDGEFLADASVTV